MLPKLLYITSILRFIYNKIRTSFHYQALRAFSLKFKKPASKYSVLLIIQNIRVSLHVHVITIRLINRNFPIFFEQYFLVLLGMQNHPEQSASLL